MFIHWMVDYPVDSAIFNFWMHTVFIIADKIVNYMKSHTGVFCLVYARVIDHLLVSSKVRESKVVLMDFGFYVLDCGFLVSGTCIPYSFTDLYRKNLRLRTC